MRNIAIQIATKHKYGIPLVVSVAVILWLATTDFTICWIYDYPAGAKPSMPTSGCESKTLLTKVINDKIWPLAYAPFTSYEYLPQDLFQIWSWLNSELYFPVISFGIAAYLIWLNVRYVLQTKSGNKTTTKAHPQSP